MDRLIHFYRGNGAHALQDAQAPTHQKAVWRGGHCEVCPSAVSLLSGGVEEISFGMSEQAEQRKLNQEARRLLIKRRRAKKVCSNKVKSGQNISDQCWSKTQGTPDDCN